MGKIFACRQIAEIDAYTIEHEGIADIDLMERASMEVTDWLLGKFPQTNKYVVFAGPGNNGGDALAVSRMLAATGFQVRTYILDLGKGLKGSPSINYNRLTEQGKAVVQFLSEETELPDVAPDEIIIDGLFGSGLTRQLQGLPSKIVQYVNRQKTKVISIDIPSGLFGEDNSLNDPGSIVEADYTLTFQFPKLSFLFPENECFVGEWIVLNIGLSKRKISDTKTNWLYLEQEEVKNIIKPRNRFAHKGTFGHALLITGSYGKMGAAVLASKACLRAGVGLVTTHVPRLCYQIIHNTVPEAMVSIDESDILFSGFPDLNRFSAVGVGPALDVHRNTQKALFHLIETCDRPMVIDADALNILGENKDWFNELPRNSVLTPHPKEFERLVGPTQNSYQRLEVLSDFAEKYHSYIVLKGAHTTIACPDRRLIFNSTGNPGMATAGSGDVLTGIITGLLAQGYSPENSALLGVYLHGLAGDLAVKEESMESIIAGDLITFLGKSFAKIRE